MTEEYGYEVRRENHHPRSNLRRCQRLTLETGEDNFTLDKYSLLLIKTYTARHLIYGGVRPLCLWKGEVSSFYFVGLRFRKAVDFSAPIVGFVLGSVWFCLGSGLHGVIRPASSVEEMSRFVGGLVACSLEMRSRLSDDALPRR
ncbi:hypothetical protein DY000_02023162 [Brassica cretica]|uniref:Uncharacterized protein n=1 Tax=Brassica cretica TaxID=69181 RepID=A0ABQ7E6S3_BRACR|nr:hypothetical protein DY000_02023162 [Brassica cretica]